MLSNTSKYAIRATIYLALHARSEIKVGIKKIAGDLNIPSPFPGKNFAGTCKTKSIVLNQGTQRRFQPGKGCQQNIPV